MSSIEITVIDREGVATPGIEWDDDESLMECLVRNKYPILASCGGNASCSTCHSYLDEDSYESNIDALFHITREAVENGRLEALRRWREALAPERLGEALSSTAVLTTLRAELRAHTGHPGHEGDSEELLHALAEGVVAHGLLDPQG